MKTYYLITGLDKLNGHTFTPDPCLFETEKEALKYIKLNESKTIAYATRKVRTGKMDALISDNGHDPYDNSIGGPNDYAYGM